MKIMMQLTLLSAAFIAVHMVQANDPKPLPGTMQMMRVLPDTGDWGDCENACSRFPGFGASENRGDTCYCGVVSAEGQKNWCKNETEDTSRKIKLAIGGDWGTCQTTCQLLGGQASENFDNQCVCGFKEKGADVAPCYLIDEGPQ